MAETALRIRGLEKSFPNFKLGPFDLTVPTGAIYGLIGPNGAGKTTTIDLIMGMGREDAGAIEVFGMDHIRDEVAVKRRIGYVSPDLSFDVWRKVYKLLGFIRRFYPDWDDAYCASLLERFGIGLHDSIPTLSFGSRTKLSLVVALSHRPALLLLDEPQSGLDAVSKRELFTELLAAVQDEERTVLIASNNLDDVERFTDHLGMIKGGRILLEGSTADLINRFRMVDCAIPDGKAPAAIPGVYPQEQRGNRWRMLVDLSSGGMSALLALGATDLADAPVTLEELFVALVKGK